MRRRGAPAAGRSGGVVVRQDERAGRWLPSLSRRVFQALREQRARALD